MRHDLICAWLQLPENTWPTDHYSLLGLPQGEVNTARLEDRVHERMGSVRRYQLTHPEEVTEVMNRLAQALLCLSDPYSKANYDLQLQSGQKLERNAPLPAPPEPGRLSADNENLRPESQESPTSQNGVESDWLNFPPPRRRPLAPVPALNETPARGSANGAAGSAITEEPSTEKRSPESAQASAAEAFAAVPLPGGISRFLTKSALYARIAQVRRLCLHWEQAGVYLNDSNRVLRRPAEATELIQHMNAIREIAWRTPKLVGQAGQAGYLVLALARQQMVVPTLQTLLPSQREALARDWRAGQERLREERHQLKREVHDFRKRSKWRHGLRLLAASLVRNPGLVLVLLSWLTLNIAMPSYLPNWERQVIVLLGLAAIRLVIWRYSVEIVPMSRSGVSQPSDARKRPFADRAKAQSSET